MTESSLSIAYGKLAYLEQIGVDPLVSVKKPEVSLLTQRVRVRFCVDRPGNKIRAAVSEHPDPNRSRGRSENVQKQGALSAIFEARTALEGRNSENKQDFQSAEYDLEQKNGNSPNTASEVLAGECFPRGSGLVISPDTSAALETPEPESSALRMQEQGESIGQSEEQRDRALPRRFSVLVCTLGNLSLIALEPTLAPSHWNLIRNIALASKPPKLEGNEPQSAPVMLEFNWPIPGIDPSAEHGAAAQSALSGFLAKQTEMADRYIVLGDRAAFAAGVYLDQLEASEVLKAEALDQLLSKPESKRDLWREMRVRGFA